MAVTPSLRFKILQRDDFTCVYCGHRAPHVELHVDHRFPVSKGGTDHPGNLVTACAECNMGKRDRLLCFEYQVDEFLAAELDWEVW